MVTWTQGAILYCVVVLALAAGIIAGIRGYRSGSAPLLRFALVSLAVACAAVAFCVVALWIFPGYPVTYVPEPVAILFTAPAVLAAITAIWAAPLRTISGRRPPLLGSGLILGIYLFGIFVSYHIFTSPLRIGLPVAASNIREHCWSDGLLPG